jgi:hypothetical protein
MPTHHCLANCRHLSAVNTLAVLLLTANVFCKATHIKPVSLPKLIGTCMLLQACAAFLESLEMEEDGHALAQVQMR